MLRSLVCATLLLSMSDLARADEPGPGGYKPPKPVTGEQVYQYVCQACHMADAKGASGAASVPALAANPRLASGDYLLVMMVRGRGAMPWFTDTLDPAQMAAVATYVRSHFGNHYDQPATVADVQRILAAGK